MYEIMRMLCTSFQLKPPFPLHVVGLGFMLGLHTSLGRLDRTLGKPGMVAREPGQPLPGPTEAHLPTCLV